MPEMDCRLIVRSHIHCYFIERKRMYLPLSMPSSVTSKSRCSSALSLSAGFLVDGLIGADTSVSSTVASWSSRKSTTVASVSLADVGRLGRLTGGANGRSSSLDSACGPDGAIRGWLPSCLVGTNASVVAGACGSDGVIGGWLLSCLAGTNASVVAGGSFDCSASLSGAASSSSARAVANI